MSVADVMSGSGLSVWAEAALLLSLAVFVAVIVAAFSGRNRRIFERARLLPLEHDGATEPERADARATKGTER